MDVLLEHTPFHISATFIVFLIVNRPLLIELLSIEIKLTEYIDGLLKKSCRDVIKGISVYNIKFGRQFLFIDKRRDMAHGVYCAMTPCSFCIKLTR